MSSRGSWIATEVLQQPIGISAALSEPCPLCAALPFDVSRPVRYLVPRHHSRLNGPSELFEYRPPDFHLRSVIQPGWRQRVAVYHEQLRVSSEA